MQLGGVGGKKKRSKRKRKPDGSRAILVSPEKQIIYMPKRDIREPFPELQLEIGDVQLMDARKFSLAVAHSNATHWREFMRIGLPSEKFVNREYTFGTGPNVQCVLKKAQNQGPWMLYRANNRADELTVLDYKETKMYYLQYMHQELLTEEKDSSLQYITDWLSIAYIMRNELERRRNGIATFGRGKRLTMTNFKISPLQHTHRKAIAKEEKKNFKIWPMMIAEAADDIKKSVLNRILYFENILRFSGHENFKHFKNLNKDWIDERMKCAEMNKQVIVKKNCIRAFNRDRPIKSVYHLASELHEFTPSLGHSTFLCRALKDLSLIIGKEEIVRKVVKNARIPLRVRPTRYEYGPGAVTTYESSRDFVEPLTITFEKSPKRAPSLDTLSGFSSESAASTATESPGDWQHNWKMQTMHHDMEHRLMDTSIQNPLEEQQLGELEASQRIANEVDRRIAMLNEYPSFDNIVGGKNSEVLQLCHKSVSTEMKLRRDVSVAKQLRKKLKEIMTFAEDVNGNDVLGLQIADYLFNEILRMLPENEKDPYDGLAINNAWKTLIDNNVLKPESREILRTMVTVIKMLFTVNCDLLVQLHMT
ncbi:unnamed protein product [Cylicocyclus nassatus]|uniref:Uncharacterized protein n=1 Tax=Cylicocyclus nassatus TaxID=53992 RepID=A0AA36DQT6_CYLNA|nr:unnamed protein product [Cylicocyclus nassatus]